MDKGTKGAWLLAQSKSLDGFSGAGATRLENIAFAGDVGRLYNLLRRNVADEISPTVDRSTIDRACQLIGIRRPVREQGLKQLADGGRISIANNGAISVLGATSTAVLEATVDIFEDLSPSNEEQAVLEISEKVADRPINRTAAAEYVGDMYRIPSAQTATLIELCKTTAIIDEETDKGRTILFNSNTFRNGDSAWKAHAILEQLNAAERRTLTEVQALLASEGALYDHQVSQILGSELFRRLLKVGYFDRMEISNTTESVGYISSPSAFQKFGRPFEEDPIDDAKALLASLTYGQTRSDYKRGNIRLPVDLLNALIAGREIGANGIKAIGEDYRELEARQVVKVTQRSPGRFTMKLLKRDVGELALTIVSSGSAAKEVVLLDGSPASSFKGPHAVRTEVRQRNEIGDQRFIADTLDRIRSGG